VSSPADESDVFSLYMTLLYVSTHVARMSISCLIDAAQTNNFPVKQAVSNEDTCDEYYDLSKLFFLAEDLVDTKTKEIILAFMTARYQEVHPLRQYCFHPKINFIQTIYHKSTDASPARKLLVAIYTEHGNASFLVAESSVPTKDFLNELSVSILGTRPLLSEYTELKQG